MLNQWSPLIPFPAYLWWWTRGFQCPSGRHRAPPLRELVKRIGHGHGKPSSVTKGKKRANKHANHQLLSNYSGYRNTIDSLHGEKKESNISSKKFGTNQNNFSVTTCPNHVDMLHIAFCGQRDECFGCDYFGRRSFVTGLPSPLAKSGTGRAGRSKVFIMKVKDSSSFSPIVFGHLAPSLSVTRGSNQPSLNIYFFIAADR